MEERKDTNKHSFLYSFCCFTFRQWEVLDEEEAGNRTSGRCAAQALGERVFILICEDAAPLKTTKVMLQIQVIPTWSPVEQTYAVFAYLSIFSRRKPNHFLVVGQWENVVLAYKVSEVHVQPYQCHAVDSVNFTVASSLSRQPFFCCCLFIGLFCFRSTGRSISLLSFICSTYTVGIFTQHSHISYIWTMSCTSFQSIQRQTRCWIVTELYKLFETCPDTTVIY